MGASRGQPRVRRPRIGGLGVALVGTLLACAAAHSQSLPEDFLGRWYYIGSSGGIAGTGIGDEATGYIVITADNTIEAYAEDGEVLSIEEFVAESGPTIFTTEEQWVLDPESMVPRVVRLYDGGAHLSISDNVYDGFSLHYSRSR